MSLYEDLEKRMGRPRLRQRLTKQAYHSAGSSHQGQGLLSKLERLFPIDQIIEFILKWSLMFPWGYNNFRSIVLEQEEWVFPELPAAFDGFRVLQLSDLHLDLDPGFWEKIVQKIEGLDYDLVVITGDFRNSTKDNSTPAMQETLELLKALEPPMYGILGNHDFIETLPELESMGLPMLLNESVPIEKDGEKIWLCGVDDAHFYKTDNLAGVIGPIPADEFTTLLCHSPERYSEAACLGYNWMLSGHTHGGQICLPGGKVLVRVCDVPDRFFKGRWKELGLQGYTSRGTGSFGVRVRFFCPPEITLHTLRK